MQNKGAIRFFAIAFALVCVFQLSYTYFAKNVEKNATEYANSAQVKELAKTIAKGDNLKEGFAYDSISKMKEKFYLDSIQNEVVYNIGIRQYTFKEVKEREINLGLDLKGGMNVTLEISVPDIIKALSGHSKNPTFNQAVAKAIEKQKSTDVAFIDLFEQAINEIDPNFSLASVFSTIELKDKVSYNSSNADIIKVLNKEIDGAIDRTFNILNTRINRFGVAQPNIQQLQTKGRILVELPGIKEPDRVRKLLQGTAQLEFWETFNFPEIISYFSEANAKLAEINQVNKIRSEAALDSPALADGQTKASTDTTSSSLIDKLKQDPAADSDLAFQQYQEQNPLWTVLQPSLVQDASGQSYPAKGARVGFAAVKDTAQVNALLKQVKNVFPANLRLYWAINPVEKGSDVHELVAIKVSSRDGLPALGGDVIVDASQDYSPTGQVEVSMSMNSEGAQAWKRLTGDNIGNQIAIVLDNYVYSFPVVNTEISGGRSSISGGGMTVEEALDIANILKAGKLPAPARIVQEEVVGPSLGKDSIDAGLMSFVIAFILVLVYMFLYYNRAGWIADLALLVNILFIFGVLASIGAVLTLPGIAGIVLTLGMAVDANVIIFERIKEELRAGKGFRLAIADGYSNAYSAIIDGNVTTLLTAIVLNVFGSGPIQGFATTLIIGILTSLFTSIFITRLIFTKLLDENKAVKFSNKKTENFLANTNFDFIGVRKYAYVFSGIIIVAGLISLFTKGLSYGVDFSGGRSYVIRFDDNVNTNSVRSVLTEAFGSSPEVKTFGPDRQVKVTTRFMIDDDSDNVDEIIQDKLYKALSPMYKTPITYTQFTGDTGDTEQLVGILSLQKVGPTIVDEIIRGAIFAIIFALIIILGYITLRFKRWQFGVGGLVSLVHDALVTLGLFSILDGILPFSMDVDQAFIAAILTIIGYSINDTVIIFDRIRENMNLHKKLSKKENMNKAMNSTLGRTMNTAGTTLVVLLAIFILGGEIIRGFAFALIIGILIGTYSSVFNSAPVAYDLLGGEKKDGIAVKPDKKN